MNKDKLYKTTRKYLNTLKTYESLYSSTYTTTNLPNNKHYVENTENLNTLNETQNNDVRDC